ncbi:GNAT family N-acetyltransferase [Paenibacillus sp. UMB7766-LJ446]|uniref:GNAT family N-acetyltransferase n=1 Tax=Paenibacillus sp. UMB7766-LJ446 TaxID=3046313 RepID=UPI00254F4EAC|nr:GNAT family N-acetyltransferase [Paenibacillus sp. UMB7766-LJ446]MDK8189117.1 GNAT family N-acetyltransferase [Paenibacillus sp. UMB7766-LJ446]
MSHLITIQPLTSSDMESACQVFETSITNAFMQEGLGALHEDIRDEIEHKKAMLHSALHPDNNKESSVFFLLAKREETVVGTISYGPCGEEIQECTNNQLNRIGELGSLYVLPEVQGQGIGSALIQALATELQRRKITQFCLDSGYRTAQQKWQRKFGEPYAVAKNFWGEGSDHMVWLCEVKDFAAK